MRGRTTIAGVVLLGSLMPTTAHAQEQRVVLDLALAVERQMVSAGSVLQLSLENLAPPHAYVVRIRERRIPVDSLPSVKLPPSAGQPEDTCHQLDQEISKLSSVLNEGQVPQRRQAVRTLLTEATDGCGARERADSLLAHTVKDLGDYVLVKGQELVVQVVRQRGTENEKNWTFTLSTGQRKGFHTHYGLSLLVAKDRRARTVATDSGFVVRELDRSNALVPSVFFSYPISDAYRDPVFGLSGGLGFDASDAAAFVGVSAIVGEHLAFSAGLAFVQRLDLKNYEDREPVKEPLGSDALLSNEPGLVFYSSMSLSINPFGSPSSEREEPQNSGGDSD